MDSLTQFYKTLNSAISHRAGTRLFWAFGDGSGSVIYLPNKRRMTQ
jgi:hypothetical protein